MNVFPARTFLNHKAIAVAVCFFLLQSGCASVQNEKQENKEIQNVEAVQKQEKSFAENFKLDHKYTKSEQEHIRNGLKLMAQADAELASFISDKIGTKKIYIKKVNGVESSYYIPAKNPEADRKLCFSDDVGYLGINLDVSSLYLIEGGDRNNPKDWQLFDKNDPRHVAATFGHELIHFKEALLGIPPSERQSMITDNGIRDKFGIPRRSSYLSTMDIGIAVPYKEALEILPKQIDAFVLELSEMIKKEAESGNAKGVEQLKKIEAEQRALAKKHWGYIDALENIITHHTTDKGYKVDNGVIKSIHSSPQKGQTNKWQQKVSSPVPQKNNDIGR